MERLIAGKGLMEDERSRMSQGKKRRRQGQRAKKKENRELTCPKDRKWIERLHNNTCVITKISVDKSPF